MHFPEVEIFAISEKQKGRLRKETVSLINRRKDSAIAYDEQSLSASRRLQTGGTKYENNKVELFEEDIGKDKSFVRISEVDSNVPTSYPTSAPILKLSSQYPSSYPTKDMNNLPTSQPTMKSTKSVELPTSCPSVRPSFKPSMTPSTIPSSQPSESPTHQTAVAQIISKDNSSGGLQVNIALFAITALIVFIFLIFIMRRVFGSSVFRHHQAISQQEDAEPLNTKTESHRNRSKLSGNKAKY